MTSKLYCNACAHLYLLCALAIPALTGCGGPPAPAPEQAFHRFVEEAAPGERWQETKARAELEYRNVVYGPTTIEGQQVPVAEDGTIALAEIVEAGMLDPRAIGVAVFWRAASESGAARVDLETPGNFASPTVTVLPPVEDRSGGREFLRDPSFESILSGERDSPWKRVPDRSAMRTIRALGEGSLQSPETDSQLTLPSGDHPTILSQSIVIDEADLADETLIGKAIGLAEDANALRLRIRDAMTGQLLAEVTHPGGGDWRELEVSLHEADLQLPAKLELQLVRTAHSEGTVALRTASLRDPAGIESEVDLWVQEVFPERFETKPVRIFDGSRLVFGIAVQRPEVRAQFFPVTFSVYAKTAEDEQQIYTRTVHPPIARKSTPWLDMELDVSNYAGRDVRLVFETKSAVQDDDIGASVPLWADPTLLHSTPLRRPRQPNVLLISLDTLRADHLGTYGYARDTSPNLDEFAQESLVFEQCYSTSSWTLPAHVSLFTGHAPVVHGAGGFVRPRLDEAAATLAEYARRNGYLTAAFTEGVAVAAELGFGQGFDRYSDGVQRHPLPPGTARRVFAKARGWMESHAPAPFFLFAHTYEIHGPYQPPGAYVEKFGDGSHEVFYPWKHRPDPANRDWGIDLYDGEIAYTDAVLGEWLDWLQTEGYLDNTIVIVFSDHGEEFYEHGGQGHNRTLYQEVLHVPLMIRLPGSNGPSGRIKPAVSLSDVFATLVDLMNFQYATIPHTSHNLMPLFATNTNRVFSRPYVTAELVRTDQSLYRFALQTDMMKYVLSADYSSVPMPLLRETLRGNTLFNGYFESNVAQHVFGNGGTDTRHAITVLGDRTIHLTEELFDRSADPGETENLAAENPAKLMEFRQQSVHFFQTVNDMRSEFSAAVRSDNIELTDEQVEAFRALGYL